jgi:CotH kinase protein
VRPLQALPRSRPRRVGPRAQALRRHRALIRTLALIIAAISALAALVAPVASADEATPLYNPDAVWVIHLTLPRASEEKLEEEPEGEYQPGEFSIAETEGVPGTEKSFSTPVSVSVRLKGSTSFESLSGKAAFKLKFKKGERPFGLKKMTLNNMVQDPSMVHETLAYEDFRATGAPAPRTGFAYVLLNGRDYGLHLSLETLDDQALEGMFGTPFDEEHQHLYEGEDGTDVLPGEEGDFEVDEGSETDISDLEALIGAVNGTAAEPWSTRIAPYADLGEMTRMWAVEKYVGQWDGYSGATGEAQPNNYYLYDDAQGRFSMIPWGQDETFQADKHLAFEGEAGVLFDKCIADEACLDTYWNSLTTALAAAKELDLPARAEALDALVRPWEEEEQHDGRFHYTRAQARATVEETVRYATQRVAEAESWLAAHVPPAKEGGGAEFGELPPSPPSPPPSGGQGSPPGASATHPAEPAATNGRPRLLGLHRQGANLRTSLLLTSSATVEERATAVIDRRRRLACSTPPKPRTAGAQVVLCKLRPSVRRALRDGSLTLRVVTVVRGGEGAVAKLRQTVRLGA